MGQEDRENNYTQYNIDCKQLAELKEEIQEKPKKKGQESQFTKGGQGAKRG